MTLNINIDVLVEEYKLDEAARERMWTDSFIQYQASIDNMVQGVKGCPLGRSFDSEDAAIADLQQRIKMESGVDTTIKNIKRRS